MSTLWFRRYQLITGTGGEGISIDNLKTAGLKLTFEITKSLQKEPNVAKFEIFNLSPTRAQAIEDEYTDLIFNAGYEGNMAMLFSGNTQYISTYRDKTEWITQLICGDGDYVYRTTFINQTFGAGTTDEEIVDAIRTQMNGKITKGPMQLSSAGSLRGRTFSRSAHEALDEIARTNGCNWSIQDGQLQMVRADSMLSADTAIVLTPETGLLEAAERTDKGITARALLNPQISVNSAVRLDNSALKTRSRTRKNILKGQSGRPVDMNADGIYKVFKVRHSGDTRANDWMTEILCVGLGQPIPTANANASDGVPIEGAA